jgi:hypothetical protein
MRLNKIVAMILSTLLCTFSLHAVPFPYQIQEKSLLKYAKTNYSQFGEEGVIDNIMARIGIRTGFLVEFGGNDGIAKRNTRVLAERGWKGLFIEQDSALFQMMQLNFNAFPKIQCLHEQVTPFENGVSGQTIDQILDRHFPNQEIDVMSIDMQGQDPLIFKNMRRQPKLIVIKGGIFWHPQMQMEVPDEIAAKNLAQPLIVMTKIAKEKGYELVCATSSAFFVRKDFYRYFISINNSPTLLWWEALVHIQRLSPDFYEEILQVRKSPWIQEWEAKDPNITFSIP